MKYESSYGLIRLINQVENNLKRNFFINLSGIIIYSILLYRLADNIFDTLYFISEILVILLPLSIDRYKTVSIGRNVNNTAIEVSLKENAIVITTASCKTLFWINRTSKELIFKIDEVKITIVDYPIKSIFDLDNRTLKLTDKEKEAFVISDYFDKELTQKIKEMYY